MNSLDLGSCFDFEGSNLFVNSSYFKNNSGYLGGAIFINGNIEGIANFVVQMCIFMENFAYLGGALGFSSNLKFLNSIIENSLFINNSATSKILFFNLR